MILRPYQHAAIEALFRWWDTRPGADQAPILVAPTGSGKSVICAEIVRLLWERWPTHRPRTVVLVPGKELAEQNAAKLATLLPEQVRLGYYSAAIGQKRPDADVIVATIGSIYKSALALGDIRCVVIDECHMVNTIDKGRYRQFLTDLAKVCKFRVVGMTATPFRGNGVWLTAGEAPLFTGIAHTITMQELLEVGHLAPLVPPESKLATRVDVTGISTSAGDYNIKQLDERVTRYIPGIVDDTLRLANDRKKWIAFTPTVKTAAELTAEFCRHQINAAVVTGETDKRERETLIERFRAGNVRCLVTVLALATGFDVPDVDCIVWARATISPVLYIQGAGRGARPAPGKVNCLWLDFTDTTERLGPIDAIKGRAAKTRVDQAAPFAVCSNCGNRVVPASLPICPHCGALMREEEEQQAREVSTAPVLSSQIGQKINTYMVTETLYNRHEKAGGRPTLRVDYVSGLRVVAKEWICLEHDGWPKQKAEGWWRYRAPQASRVPSSVDEAIGWIGMGLELRQPASITVNETGKYPEVVGYDFAAEPATAS